MLYTAHLLVEGVCKVEEEADVVYCAVFSV